MDLSYLITPFFAWLVAGCAKFAINTLRAKRLAFDLIGYGGMPSNHSSIVSSAAAIIAFNLALNGALIGFTRLMTSDYFTDTNDN